MATLSAIYKISADITALQRGVEQGVNSLKRIDSQTSAMGLGFDRLKSVIAGTFTVTAVVAFTKELLADADALQKLSDKTGLSLQALQKFQIVGDDAGNTIEQLTTAISQMENRLASGDKSAVSAVETLGLTFEELKRMGPEQQMYAISDAIRAIKDPAEQTRLAMDLFGRSGAEILPTLKKGFDDVRDSAVGMSDETIEALDTLGDRMQAWWRTGKAVSAGFLVELMKGVDSGWNPNIRAANDYIEVLKKVQAQQAAMIPKALASGPSGLTNGLPAIGLPTPETYRELAVAAERTVAATKAQKAASEDLAKSLDKVVDINRAIIAQQPQVFNSEPIAREIDTIDTYLTRLERVRDIEQQIANANPQRDLGVEALTGELQRLTGMVNTEFVGPLEEHARAGGRSFGDFFTKELGGVILSAFTGGGNVLKSIGSAVGGFFGGPIGSLFGGLLGGIGKLFEDPEKQINPIREAFVQAAGGLDMLNKKADQAGITLNHLLDAKNPKQYQKAIEELQHAFEFQAQALDTLDDTVARYGLELSQLGPEFQAQELHQQMIQYAQDWAVLRAAGADYSTIVMGAGDAFIQMVQQAIAAGVSVPEALRPMIQRAIEMGLILDANGVAFTTIEETGLQFTESLGASMDSLIDSIHELVDAITVSMRGGLTEAQRLAQAYQAWLDANPFIGRFITYQEWVASQPPNTAGGGGNFSPDLLPSSPSAAGSSRVVAAVDALRADMRSRDALLERTLMQAVQVAVARAA